VRRQAGERGIIKKVVAAIDCHTGDEALLLHALTAVTNLTHNNVDNRFRLPSYCDFPSGLLTNIDFGLDLLNLVDLKPY
jgi:hypothetical protein